MSGNTNPNKQIGADNFIVEGSGFGPILTALIAAIAGGTSITANRVVKSDGSAFVQSRISDDSAADLITIGVGEGVRIVLNTDSPNELTMFADTETLARLTSEFAIFGDVLANVTGCKIQVDILNGIIDLIGAAINGATLRVDAISEQILFIINGAVSAQFDVNGTTIAVGTLLLNRTITAGGTTGNQTINKAAGTVNIAAGNSTVTVTNNLVTANSIIMAIVRTNDATAQVKNVVPGSGSFVINMIANVTAETSVGFIVTN